MNNNYETSRGARAKSVTVKSTSSFRFVRSCGFDPHSRKLNIYLHLYFRSGVQAKSCVEFRHSTCNASVTWRKVGNGVS